VSVPSQESLSESGTTSSITKRKRKPKAVDFFDQKPTVQYDTENSIRQQILQGPQSVPTFLQSQTPSSTTDSTQIPSIFGTIESEELYPELEWSSERYTIQSNSFHIYFVFLDFEIFSTANVPIVFVFSSSSFSDDNERPGQMQIVDIQTTEKEKKTSSKKEDKKKKKHKKHKHHKKEKKSKKDVVKYDEGKLDTRKPSTAWLIDV
jgi:hypothetical protein